MDLPAELSRPSSGSAVVRSDDSDSSDDVGFESGDLDPGFQSTVVDAGWVEPVDSMVVEPIGVQLPQADVVHQTRPGLFDTLPSDILIDAHRVLENWPHAGDRMMLAPLLPVSLQAQRVASALLWHGWSSIPSRERVSAFTSIRDLSNISKGFNELEKAGILSKRQRTDTGRGYTGNRYTFCGLVICQYLVECCHPPLAQVAREILAYHAGLSEAENSRGVRDTLRATDGESRGVRGTPRDSSGEAGVVARKVCDTLPGGYHIPYNHDDDLIDKKSSESNQSVNQGSGGVPSTPRDSATAEGRRVPDTPRGEESEVRGRGVELTPRGRAGRECGVCGSSELNDEACAACGVLVDAPDDSSFWPEWYRDFASRMPSDKLPDWQSLDEDRQAAGWSNDVLRESAARYERKYAGERVSSPSALFRTIAASVASERLRSRRGRGGAAGGARHSGGPRDPGPSVSEESAPAPTQAVCTCEEIAAAEAEAPDSEAQQLWAKTLETLSLELPVTTFETWLKDSVGLRCEGDNLAVRVASVFTIAWIEQRMYQTILRALRGYCGPTWDVHFEVSEQAACRVHGSSMSK